MGYSFITLREPWNNQRPRCDIACLHVTNHLYHGFPNCSVCLMVFNATFNNISVITWRSILLVVKTGRPGENHRSVASH